MTACSRRHPQDSPHINAYRGLGPALLVRPLERAPQGAARHRQARRRPGEGRRPGAGEGHLRPTAPSASARCAGCGRRPLRSCRCRAAGTRRSLRPRDAGAARPCDERLHHRDGAGRGERPVRGELRGVDGALVGMAVDADHPWDIRRNLLSSSTRAQAMRSISPEPPGRRKAWPGREQHLGLEHEAVADDAHVGTGAEDLPQAPEEVGAVARRVPAPAGPAPR